MEKVLEIYFKTENGKKSLTLTLGNPQYISET